LLDAVGMSVGFTLTLTLMGAVREVLGNGTFLGHAVFGPNYEPWVIMILPPGGFFTLGVILLVFSWIKRRSEARLKSASVTAAVREAA
jgi:electron transport complex protein RnfE